MAVEIEGSKSEGKRPRAAEVGFREGPAADSLEEAESRLVEPSSEVLDVKFRKRRRSEIPLPENTQKARAWCSLNSLGAGRQKACNSEVRKDETPVKLR